MGLNLKLYHKFSDSCHREVVNGGQHDQSPSGPLGFQRVGQHHGSYNRDLVYPLALDVVL